MLNTKNIEYICDYIAHIKKIENPEIKNLVRKERKTKEEKELAQAYNRTANRRGNVSNRTGKLDTSS